MSISLFFAAVALVYAAPDPLDAVFARIDAAAKTFKGMTADVSDTQHTAIVDDDDVKTGTIKMLLKGTEMHMLVDLKGGSGAQMYALDGHDARIYSPNTHIVDVYDLSSRQNLVSQFVMLGFGATSAGMRSTNVVTYVGEEKIGDQQTSHITLVPKPAETRRNLKQADLWFGANGLVVQQKFLQASGDYKLATYSHMRLVAPAEKELELKPSGATIQKHDS
jgi:hypothetical protein